MSSDPQPISSIRHSTELQKLTDWASEPDLAELKGDIEAAKPHQQQHMIRVQRWLDNLNMEGSAVLKVRKGRSSVQPKLIKKQAEWRYAPLSEPFLSSDKLFSIAPVTFEDMAAAAQNELVLNWQMRTKMNPVLLIDQYVRTATDEGTVVIRTGWNRETKKEKIQAPVYEYYEMTDAQQIQAITEAAKLEMDNPAEFKKLPKDVQESVRYSTEKNMPTEARHVRFEEVEITKVLRNEPTVEIINSRNLIVDATCGADPSKALFMAYSMEITRGELKRDGRYKNLDAIDWGRSILQESDHAPTGPAEVNFRDKGRQKVILNEYYGYWDIHKTGNLVAIYVAWVGNVIVRCELNPFPDGRPPFTIVPYRPIKGSIYGEPDGELLEDNQRILGAVTRGMIDLMGRSANGQRGMAKSMLDLPNRKRFEAGEDYEFNPNVHPSNGIFEHKFPEIPQSAMGMLQMINQDSESLTGVKVYGDGMSGASLGPTAAGAKGMLAAGAQREMGILRRLAKGWAEVGTKIMLMNQELMSEEETIRITNTEFVKVMREDLKGNFDMMVAISSAEEDNAKANDLSFMLQTMGPNMDPEMTKLVMSEIARLRRMPTLAHQIKNYQPTPDPIAEEKAKLELEELRAKVAHLQAQAMERQAQAQLDGAKARSETSKADLNDLDFVEQESGVKHARDIDKVGEQAEANQRLAVTKGILDKRKPGADNPESKVPDAPDDDNIVQAIGFGELTRTDANNRVPPQ